VSDMKADLKSMAHNLGVLADCFDTRERFVWQKVSDEARRYAGHYKEASDGRNTFILFAEWAEREGNL
jgi:hypothetical protein